MKSMKTLLALMTMGAAFSEMPYTEGESKLSEEDLERYRARQDQKKKESYERRMKAKGLSKFKFGGEYLWALNYDSAKRKAKKKGLI